ncbi:glycosyltransferase [Enterococcus sp. 22-H-5-01]|uniref:glycosyltransferase n=1 Tax=Enterococcus sp. 22-H-5-01 TaxID=3418555 RepID=UPI003D02D830
MKKKWVTIFPRCENIHITKDVGVIPGLISEQYKDYDCFIVSWKNGQYPDEKKFFPKLKHKFINKYFFTHWNRYFEAISELLSVALYIFKEGKAIDVVHFFHLRWYTSILIVLFKKINPNGKVYLKLDIAESILELQVSSKILPIIPLRYEKVLSKTDFISIETKMLSEELTDLWKKKVLYIPNGYFPYNHAKIESSQKSKSIIHVSRMGTYQKNTEFLLKGIVKNQKVLFEKNWKILLVGEMSDSIKVKLSNLYNEHPLLKDIIEVIGEVKDKNKLWKLYSESRIFILTSRYESFGIVLVEALSAGNQILTSNIISANDIVADKRNGMIYEGEDISDFSIKLIQLINNSNWEEDSEYVQSFAQKNFHYPIIIKKLMREIDE